MLQNLDRTDILNLSGKGNYLLKGVLSFSI